MSDPPKLDVLARRYVELWQDQLAAAASDPELAESITRIFQLFGAGTAASAALWQGLWTAAAQMAPAAAKPRNGNSKPKDNRRFGSDESESGNRENGRQETAWQETPRATAAPDPSDERGRLMEQLNARLALLEERLAALETGAGSARPIPPARPGRRRTR